MRPITFLTLAVLTTAILSGPLPAQSIGGCPDCAGADGQVDIQDLLALLGAWGTPGPCDANGDGQVGIDDLLEILSAWGPCPDLQLVWPMPGLDAQDWVINNYVDLDPGAGLLDYMGGTKTYNGHNGTDIDVPTFRAMDDDFPILAAAPGVVVATDDAHVDRYTSCGPTPWNFVTIEHANGWRTTYGHLKQSSIVVALGEPVSAGQMIGVVGSSGCSTHPHLHLEVRDESNALVDPFLESMWIDPPVYDTPLGFMDAVLTDAWITSVDVIKDPPPNITQLFEGQLGVGLSMAGGEAGDEIEVRVIDAGGAQDGSHVIELSQVHRHSFWICNFSIAGTPGAWTVEIRLNGQLAADYAIEVLPQVQEVRVALSSSQYQSEFDSLVGQGYRLVWIDGYDVDGSTFFNAIFEQGGGAPWQAAHGMTAAQYQSLFDSLVGQGFRLDQIDSYLSGGAIRYAAIFVQQGGSAWAAYHGLTNAQHQAQFDSLVGQGFRAKTICPVEVGGTVFVTALYDQDDVGGFVAMHGLSESDYQTAFNQQANAGRALAYVNGYTEGGQARISAIWNGLVPASWVAAHGQTQAQFQQSIDNWTQAGLFTRLVTGYADGTVANFAGMWSD